MDTTSQDLTPKAQETRQHILETALGLFQAQGYDKTTMREIAAAADCSLGLAYRYFDGKEALVRKGVGALTVLDGDTVEISIEMKAPGPKGRYESYWIFKTDQGKKFGVGADFDQPIAVKITVPGIKPAKPFDFAHEFCNAIWKDKAGRLLCNGNPAAYKNAVGYTTTVKMENGKEDNEPALLININTGDRVEASYPSVDIQAGDRFISRIGCVNGNLTCKVQIILSYEVVGTGQQVVLTKYIEDYDKKSEVLEFDLSSLAGKKVVFDLEIIAKSDSGINQIFWMAPSILNP